MAEYIFTMYKLSKAYGKREVLKNITLAFLPGAKIGVIGSNGAGKSTLLRAAAGLAEPQRGRADAPKGVALLPQRPGDLFVHERVGDEVQGEAGTASLRRFGLDGLSDADPRDLAGGERQRLALAIVVAGRDSDDDELPGALLLDEPTRGMDRARKGELADLARGLSDRGCAVVIATHDVEFAATFAERVVLLGRGEVVADGSAGELLSGGWYFSSEVARILGGAAITVEQGSAVVREAIRGAPTGERAR
jgi:energy-coupling factor transport system ATP-binding protein